MDASADRPEFAPPPQPGLLRALALAVAAHLLLLLALTHGLHWQREVQDAAVEAELWSALPQEAAPKPEPAPVVAPPPPAPTVKAPPQPEPPVKSEADIALERAKEKKLEQQKREAELEKQRAKLEAQKKQEEAKKKREEELAKRKLEQQKQLAEAKRKEEDRKRKLAEQEAREAKLRDQIRQDTMKRMAQAAGTGAPDAAGTAARSSGPSASWAGRVVGKVRPNIVFTGERVSTWQTDVEVRLAPDGTIVSRRVVKSNAPSAWNDAVLRALDKTQVLPRDTDGHVPSSGTIVFRPD